MVLLAIVLLSFLIPWEPIQLFHGRKPVFGHFAACVLLLMIDVPLALALWHRRQSRTMVILLLMIPLNAWHRRTGPPMAVLFLAVAFVTFIAAHFKVTGDRSWSPNTPIMLIWTLLLLLDGLGRKRVPTGANPEISKPQAAPAPEHGA